MSAVDPYPGCEPGVCRSAWASHRVVMVGQAPSANGSHDPRHALTGAPMRKLFKVSGMNLMTYLRTFERHNLVPRWEGYNRTGDSSSGSRFDEGEASVTARVLADRLAGGRRLLCWGAPVLRAFSVEVDFEPCHWTLREVPGLDNAYDCPVAYIPHPSGLNRWWNEPGNADRAGQFLRDLVADVARAYAASYGQGATQGHP